MNEKPDDAMARTLTRPEMQAAALIQELEGDHHEVNALVRELSSQVAAVNGGDLRRAEGMLTCQAHTLDELARRCIPAKRRCKRRSLLGRISSIDCQAKGFPALKFLQVVHIVKPRIDHRCHRGVTNSLPGLRVATF